VTGIWHVIVKLCIANRMCKWTIEIKCYHGVYLPRHGRNHNWHKWWKHIPTSIWITCVFQVFWVDYYSQFTQSRTFQNRKLWINILDQNAWITTVSCQDRPFGIQNNFDCVGFSTTTKCPTRQRKYLAIPAALVDTGDKTALWWI